MSVSLSVCRESIFICVFVCTCSIAVSFHVGIVMHAFLVAHACVCMRGCVRSRFSFDKTPVFRGIISPSPDSNMLCIYGGNKLTCNGQTDNWLKLLLEIVSLISQTELERRRSRSNIFRGSKTCCATHHEGIHPVEF